jgi:hypothetical protein
MTETFSARRTLTPSPRLRGEGRGGGAARPLTLSTAVNAAIADLFLYGELMHGAGAWFAPPPLNRFSLRHSGRTIRALARRGYVRIVSPRRRHLRARLTRLGRAALEHQS